MRDSLGAGTMRFQLFARVAGTCLALITCATNPTPDAAPPSPKWRCYTFTADSVRRELVPASMVLGAASDRSGTNVANVTFDSALADRPLTRMAHWTRRTRDSITVVWPVHGPRFAMAVILSAQLIDDSLIGQVVTVTDMGAMDKGVQVHGALSCKAGA
jgi:hypothetical protein